MFYSVVTNQRQPQYTFNVLQRRCQPRPTIVCIYFKRGRGGGGGRKKRKESDGVAGVARRDAVNATSGRVPSVHHEVLQQDVVPSNNAFCPYYNLADLTPQQADFLLHPLVLFVRPLTFFASSARDHHDISSADLFPRRVCAWRRGCIRP